MTDGISNMHEQIAEKAKAAEAKAPEKKTRKKRAKKEATPKQPVYGNIYGALAAAQVDLKEIDADGVNDHFGNRYTTLGALLGAVRPVLAKHGIALSMTTRPVWGEVDSVTKSEGTTTTTTHREMLGHDIHCVLYYGASLELAGDERIVSTLFVPKGGNIQQFGSALTYCRRYLVQSIVAVHTDKDDDGNDAVGNKPTKAQPRGTNQVREHLQGKN